METGIRNRRGAPARSVSASEAKNQFGRVLDAALEHGAVVITKHDAPRAVLLSIDEFTALVEPAALRLESLSGEFDALLARMQRPGARAAMRAAFGASARELGRAAVTGVRRRG